MSAQFYTLNMLKDRVDSMIKEQGENAPVAWWIFTSEDVIKYDDEGGEVRQPDACLLYTSPSPRDATLSRMPSSA